MQQLLDQIAAAQQADGSFAALTSPHQTNFQQGNSYTSPFFTGLIVHALAPHQDHLKYGATIRTIITQAATYLLTQKSEHWSFNYWDRQSPQAKTTPYPDDLDDTFSSLSAIQLALPDQVTGEALGSLTKILTSLETQPGGPYRTWLVPSSAAKIWLDIDIAVNAQVAYLLTLLGIKMPKLEQYFINEMTAHKIQSPYYPTPYPIYYYLSRICPESAAPSLTREIVTTGANLSPEDQLNRALLIASLTHLKADLKDIVAQQDILRANLTHPPFVQAFCLDPMQEGQQFYAGSETLTAAFVFAALIENEPAAKTLTDGQATGENPTTKRIATLFNKRLSHVDKFFKDRIVQAKERILTFDESQHITTLPQLFFSSLTPSIASQVHDHPKIVEQLGLANLYGWIAYTLADDIVDGERDSSTLPVATFALREMLHQFTTLPNAQPDFLEELHTIIDKMEAANYWEASYARVVADATDQLLEASILRYNEEHYINRSLGHALTPIAILSAAGFSMQSKEVEQWRQFFCHYLAARQLNDDAHDWLLDLKAGRLNPINISLLRSYKKQKPAKSPRLPILYQELEKIFWHHELPVTSQKILTHVNAAKVMLADCDFIAHKEPFLTLLSQPEHAALQALSQQKNAADFLSAYYDNPPSPRR